MKKKGGAILIGFKHAGLENAKRVIAELEKQGLKNGDLIALEGHKEAVKLSLKLVGNRMEAERLCKGHAGIISNLEADIFHLKNSARKGADVAKALRTSKAFLKFENYTLDSLIFNQIVYSLFVAKKARLLPLDKESAVRRASPGKATGRREERIRALVLIPIREKRWKRVLQNAPEKPRFVLCGGTHLSAVKKMIPYEKAINLAPVKERIKQTPKAVYSRLLYKAIKAKKKLRRSFGAKPRLARK